MNHHSQIDLFTPLEADEYWQALGRYKGSTSLYRITPKGEKTVPELVCQGDVVTTNYNTGPYRITKITLIECKKYPPCYSLRMARAEGGKDSYYINELVAINGRLIKLFKTNSDEVFYKGGETHAQPNAAGWL